jgi:hypothetical protein
MVKRVMLLAFVTISIENLKAEINFVVTKSEQYFSWNQYGINLYVPQDALPEEMQQCIIHIKINTMERCQLPQDTYFTSPVYLIKCIPVCQFSKPLILEIQHCAKQNILHKLCFVRSTNADLSFDIVDAGNDHIYHTCFPQHCSYGFIELDRFCRYATAQTQTESDATAQTQTESDATAQTQTESDATVQTQTESDVTAQTQTTESGSCEQFYRANIFYEKVNTKRYIVHFVILQNTDAPNKVRQY